jgi:hypothetical protein
MLSKCLCAAMLVISEPQALAQGGLPPGLTPTLLGDRILFTQDSERRVDSLRVDAATEILLDGNDFTLEISKRLELNEPLMIRAFDADTAPALPGTVAKANRGLSWVRGPGTTGNTHGDGNNGGPGDPGLQGLDGIPGRPAGIVVIKLGANAEVRGKLSIVNSGETGGPGGVGGQGGDGGDGQQGARGQLDRFRLCKKGPAFGGTGGPGGPGGPGGNGGIVILQANSSANAEWLRTVAVDVTGGAGGRGGDPGPGGVPGKGGYGGGEVGGDPPFRCDGRETQRMGADGSPGEIGKPGLPGEKGADGRLVILN